MWRPSRMWKPGWSCPVSVKAEIGQAHGARHVQPDRGAFGAWAPAAAGAGIDGHRARHLLAGPKGRRGCRRGCRAGIGQAHCRQVVQRGAGKRIVRSDWRRTGRSQVEAQARRGRRGSQRHSPGGSGLVDILDPQQEAARRRPLAGGQGGEGVAQVQGAGRARARSGLRKPCGERLLWRGRYRPCSGRCDPGGRPWRRSGGRGRSSRSSAGRSSPRPRR